MLKKKRTHRGTALIALLAVVGALASAPVAGAAPFKAWYQTDASWAEGV